MNSSNVKVDEIQTAEPFKSLFPVAQATINAIEQDMRERGYDPAQPVSTWNGVLVDGHTRVQAAKRIGFIEIPAVAQDFADEAEAVLYAIHCQRDRRNVVDTGSGQAEDEASAQEHARARLRQPVVTERSLDELYREMVG